MKTESKGTEELDRRLWQKWLSGIWRIDPQQRTLDPKTRVKPHLWKWADVYDGLLQARDQISIRGGSVERRVIRLVNPGMPEIEMTSHTMAAIRFILQGKGGYTTVEGQKMVMEEGDLILTPQWSWHEHANRSAKDDAILFSMSDAPVLKAFGLHREERQGETHIGL